MKRHAALLSITLAAAVLAGCGSTSDIPAPKPAASTSPTGSPSAAAKTGGAAPAYKFPANLCAVIKFEAFNDITPGTPRAEEKLRREGSTFSSATCVATLSGLHGDLYVSTDIEVFKEAFKARAQYEGFKGIAVRDYKDVTGIGDAAHFYTDPALGPTLVVHHGTVNLEVSVTTRTPAATLPADSQLRLTAQARQILSALPRA